MILIENNVDQRVTIYDIAERANVSISTVSRVFNNNPSVSKKTRRKVQKVIEEMNYIPSAIARSLVSQSSKTIGLIVSDVTNPFFTDTIDGIESVLSARGYTVLLCDTRYSYKRESKYISQMFEKRVDGIIIFSAYANDMDLITKTKRILPLVSVQSTFKGVDCINTTISPRLTTVSQPFYDMGKTAAELLIKRINENTTSTPQTILLPTKLVIRESTRPL